MTERNTAATTFLCGVVIGFIVLLCVGAIVYPTRKNRAEPKPEPVLTKVNIINTDPGYCQIRWAKITADGHEYLVFQPAGNGQSVIHSVSCTNCAPKTHTWNSHIDWSTILNCTTSALIYTETQL